MLSPDRLVFDQCQNLNTGSKKALNEGHKCLTTIDKCVIANVAKKIKGRPGSADDVLSNRKATVAKEQQVAPASSREISMLKGMRIIHQK